VIITAKPTASQYSYDVDEFEEEEEEEEEEEMFEQLPPMDPQLLKRQKMIEDYKVMK